MSKAKNLIGIYLFASFKNKEDKDIIKEFLENVFQKKQLLKLLKKMMN